MRMRIREMKENEKQTSQDKYDFLLQGEGVIVGENVEVNGPWLDELIEGVEGKLPRSEGAVVEGARIDHG